MKIYASIFSLLALLSCKTDLKKETDLPYSLKIAYNVLYDGEADNYEVFSMDMDGSNKTNITNFPGVEWTYYAHDDNLYFVTDKDTLARNYQLYKMKADGSEKTKISALRLKDSWHSSRKNDTEFIVTPYQTVDTVFYIIDINGKVLNKIKPDLKYFSDPAFSSDGQKVAFRGAHYSSKREKEFVDEIYIMNDDGSDLKQLTHYPENDTTVPWYGYRAGPPKWHPTENYISYASFQKGKYRLFGISLDGAKHWEIHENENGNVYHDWSPDGKWLVTDSALDDAPPFHIELVNMETKESTILTDSTYQFHQSPVFVKVYD